MPVSIPPIVTEPFAKNAATSAITLPIPLASQIGLIPGAASFEDGFPPVTMQPIVSGGIPPFGQDMNGILFMLSSHTAFAQGGQWYEFDPTVASAIGGYALGTYLAMADGSGFWLSTAAGNSANPDTGGAGWVALYSYGEATIPVTVGTLALTPAHWKKRVLVVTGALVGNVQLVFPNTSQEWLIVNNTTGAFGLSVTCLDSPSQLPIAAGGANQPTGIWSDGTTLFLKFQPATAQAYSQDPTGLTLAQRTNAGYLLATYFNQNSPIEDAGIGAVFYQNPQADGYLRKSSVANFIYQLGLATTGWVNQLIAWLAPKESPGLTGVPTAPTAPAGTATAQLATTAFVKAAVLGTYNIGTNGWQRFASGLVLQWGQGTSGTNVAFQKPLTALFSVTVSQQVGAGNQPTMTFLTGQGPSGFSTSATNGGALAFNWVALGYSPS